VTLNSKKSYLVYSRTILVLAGLQIFTIAALGQAINVGITIDHQGRNAVVSGRSDESFTPASPLNIAFKRAVAGFSNLGSRIRDLELEDRQGNRVEVRKLMDGEYLAAGEYRSWRYTVDLTPPKDRKGYAHASWLGDVNGVLMLGDLIPEYRTPTRKLSGRLELKLPDGWNSESSETAFGTVDDLSRTVIFIGKGQRRVDVKASNGAVGLILNGQWHFTEDEAAQMVREIFDEYAKLIGQLPKKPYLITVNRFPGEHPAGQWEAEARGRTVTIFSSDMPFRTQSLQRLHEQLRHEIFHLWFPNGIDLIGDYAWFYEGFAMYSSLKLAVKLNRIRFEDFLDTLGRAHTIDSNSRPRKALTDPTIDPTVRYARGMMVAFLTDLKLLGNSRGKLDVGKSLGTLLVDQPRVAEGRLSADVVKTVVTDSSIMHRYVEGVDAVDWTNNLADAGIESKQTGRTTTLAITAKPNGRQKEILDRLGYNNWRKVGTKK
jgi:hypothetical protein